MPAPFAFPLSRYDGVRAVESVGLIQVGDTGHVVARWQTPTVTVRWNNGTASRIHRKRVERFPEASKKD